MMDQREKTRGQRYAVYVGIIVAVLYIVFVTISMVALYRLAVSQTARIQSLETVASELTARVLKLESSFTAQASDEKSVGETVRGLDENSKRLKTKVSSILTT